MTNSTSTHDLASARYFCDTCDCFTITSTTCEHCDASVWIDTHDDRILEMIQEADVRCRSRRSRQCLWVSAIVNFPIFVVLGMVFFIQLGKWVHTLFRIEAHWADFVISALILMQCILPFVGFFCCVICVLVTEDQLMKFFAPASIMAKIQSDSSHADIQLAPRRSVLQTMANHLADWKHNH